MDIQLSQHVDRSAEDVFRFIATDHLANHPRWDSGIETLTQREPGPIHEGTELELVRHSMGMRQAMRMRVTTFDEPGNRFGFHGDSKQVDVDVLMTISSAPGGGSDLGMSVHAESKGIARLMGPMISSQMRKQVTQALGRIEGLLETQR